MKTEFIKIDAEKPDEKILADAGAVIRAGGLVAFPTETVYGLGGNALDPKASEKIYAAKGRPSDNPLIVHIAEIKDLYRIAEEVPEKALRLAEACWPGPLTMILKKKDIVPLQTTGGLDTVAVRMPSNRIAALFIKAAGGFVAAPSANLSGRPSPTKAAHVREDLGGRIDMILDGGESVIGLESTIVDCTEDPFVILRPGYIDEKRLKEILGEIRNDPALMTADSGTAPKAPGMKYRHYAPKCDLTIVEGEPDKVAESIRAFAAEAAANGKRTAVICSEETASCYKDFRTMPLGSLKDEEMIAHRLFDTLRKLDEENMETVFSESFDTENIGAAIMNRLLKAAGNRVVRV